MHTAQPAETQRLSERDRETVRADVQRILGSPAFRGSRRCCRFLSYSVEHVLTGSLDDLRERTVGIEVFDRAPDYDTADDAVVRVTATEVRKRLAQYYQESGKGANPVISLPPGSYAISIRWETVDSPVRAAPIVQQPASRSRLWVALAIGLVVGGIAGALASGRGAAVPSSGSAPPQKSGPSPLWSKLFRSGQKTNIVIADASRFEIQELLGRDLTLRDYTQANYPANLLKGVSPDMQRVIRFMSTRQTTSVASAAVGSRLLELGRSYHASPVLRHPRHLNVREFKSDNFIILGSRLSIPWVELFEPALQFDMRIDPQSRRFYLNNRAPKAGEPERYYGRSSVDSETYVDVALLPNLDGTGIVLILDAIDMLGVETAADAVINGWLGALEAGRYGEMLLRIQSIAGAASKSEIVAAREIASPPLVR
jgi:hypothetical protein